MRATKSITKLLNNAFSLGLISIFFISMISLVSWYQQDKQVNAILEEYFPKLTLARELDNDINGFFNELERFSTIRNNVTRQQVFDDLNNQLIEIGKLLTALNLNDQQTQVEQQLHKLTSLIKDINNNILLGFSIENKKKEIITKVQWINDDFYNDFVALTQELNWQQSNLLVKGNAIPNVSHSLNVLQNELQQIYKLSEIKENIRSEIIQFVYNLDKEDAINNYDDVRHIINIIYAQTSDLSLNANLNPLKQMVDLLVKVTLSNEDLYWLINDVKQYQVNHKNIDQQQNVIIKETKDLIDHIILSEKENFSRLSQSAKSQTKIAGMLTVGLLLFSFLFIGLFKYFYIKRYLTARFTSLIHTVQQLNKGNTQLTIPIVGNDEITEIAQLLRRHTEIMQEKELITQNLRDTQNELIQTAKLAVVGQTMTTLAHEINQPLNAISIYLFNLKRVLSSYQDQAAQNTLEKMAKLTERITKLIKGLRQFAKRDEKIDDLSKVNLHNAINEAWELLETRHKSVNGKLACKGNADVYANPVLLEQIFVNLFANSLDACKTDLTISIEIVHSAEKITVLISDNGIGWGINNSEKLLQPFYTNKEVGLGLGLTICKHIMEKFEGNIFIASSLNKSAVVILEFPVRVTLL